MVEKGLSGLNQKLLRDLRVNWRMLAAVTSIISIGIGCFIGMMSASRNLESARSNYYATSRLADFWIDLKKAPKQEIQRLANLPGVQEIHTRIQFKVLLDLPLSSALPGEVAQKPISAQMISLPDSPRPAINNIQIQSGSYFSLEEENEVILGQTFANARGIVPGDVITAILNNQKKHLRVVGTATSSEFIYHLSPGAMIEEPGTFGLLFIKESYAESIFGFDSACNSVLGLLSPQARTRVRDITAQLSRELTDFGVFSARPRSEEFSPMILDGELKQLRSMALTLPSFFLGVAALMLNILMLRMAEQQRTIIGTLKALGYNNIPIMAHFLKFGVSAGLLGGLLGAGLGIWFAAGMTSIYTQYFTLPDLSTRFHPELLAAGLGISILFSVLGTLKGASRIVKLAPADAMRAAAPHSGGKIWCEQITWLWKRLDSQWQMILRGLIRQKNRSIVAIIASSLGASIVVLAFGFVNSMDNMVARQFHQAMTADYHLVFNRELTVQTLDEVRRLPGVTLAEPVFTLAVGFENLNHTKKGAITGIMPGSQLTRPLDARGSPIPLPKTGLIMSRRLMGQLKLQPGDPLRIIPVKGDKTPRVIQVNQAVTSIMGLGVYADFHWLNRVMGQSGTISEIRITATHSSKEYKQFMAAVKNMPGLEALTDLGAQKTALTEKLDGAMGISALIMILFSGIIFFGAVLNNTLVAVSERARELATFRTMGYYESEVAGLFLRENLITGIIGTLIGLPLGRAMLGAAMDNFATDAFSFPAFLAPISYLYTLVLSLFFVFLTQVVVIRILKRQNWAQALSLKE